MTNARLRVPPATRLTFTGQSMNILPGPPKDVPTMVTVQCGYSGTQNISVGGYGWLDLAADADHMADLAACARNVSGLVDILVMNGGQGDILLDGMDGAESYAEAVSYATAARALGYDSIVGVTMPDFAASEIITAAMRTARTESNALLLADASDAFDVVADCGAALDDATDTAYFAAADPLHLTQLGGSVMASVIAAAVLTL